MNSEEQYKYIEQKIVEAANHNEYTYSNEAWKRMELLLDKKDKKRRFFFWLFPALLLLTIGGGIVLYTNSNSANGSTNQLGSTAYKQENTINSTLPKTTINDDSKEYKSTTELKDIIASKEVSTKDKGEVSNTTSQTLIQQAPQSNDINNKNGVKNSYAKLGKKPTAKKRSFAKILNKKDIDNKDEEVYTENKLQYQTNKKAKVKVTTPDLEEENLNQINKEPNEIENSKSVNERVENKIADTPKADDKKDDEAKKPVEEKEIKKDSKPKPTENKKKEKKSQFFVVALLGAEVNTTKLLSFNNTKVVPRYGAAIGYQFSNRLSVQTGFYVSGKKYIAKKSDYKFDPNNYLSNLDITKIDANCKVFEIPISVQYNFINKPQLNVFGSVGLSSYIMKKEDYVYDYWYGSVFYSTPWTYTKNTHLFAAASFSIGIEKPISKKINLQFSPRINIPLGGVGQGEVKLFSSGIDFGVKYFPLKK